MTPAQNSAVKVAINFGVVIAAFWVGDYTTTLYKNWKANSAAKMANAGAGAAKA